MRAFRRTQVALGGTALAGLVLAGCGSPAGTESTDGTEAPPAASAGPITVGLVTPLTGGAADYGIAFANGVQLAADDINADGGIEVDGEMRELSIVTCDDEFKSDQAVACGRRLASQDGAKVIMTPSSLAAFPLMGFNEQSDFLIMATSQTPDFTQQGNELVVRFINNTDLTMAPWVELLKQYSEQSGIGTNAAVMEVNTELGQSWVANFEAEWQDVGGTITGKATYDANETDFFPQISTLLRDNPDVLVMTTVCEPTATVITQARELGFEGRFINSAACSGEELIEILGDGADGVVFESSNWAFAEGDVKTFQDRYVSEFDISPQFISGVGYEGARWLADSLSIAGTADDVTAIRDSMDQALTELDRNMFDMANLTPEGDIDFPMYVGTIEDGQIRGFRG